jgi:serine/threonine protein kinase
MVHALASGLSTRRGSLAGQRLGKYHLEALLAAGGMAEVYRAWDLDLERPVAVKVLDANLAEDERFLSQFREEAHRVARLHHPNIVPMYYIGETECCGHLVPHMVMPLLQMSLRDQLRLHGILPYAEAVRLVLDVAGGLQAAHTAGLIHCDIKPGNILLDTDRHAFLADFGIALTTGRNTSTKLVPKTDGRIGSDIGSPETASSGRKYQDLRQTQTAQTLHRGVAGTPAYMAPEQLLGGAVDQRADVYGLGAVLYELLTGLRPFYGDTPVEIANHALHDPIIPPSVLVHERALPTTLDHVVLTALSRDPLRRFGTVEEFALALRAAVPVPFPVPWPFAFDMPHMRSVPNRVARRRLGVPALFVLLVSFAALTTGFLLRGSAGSLSLGESESIGVPIVKVGSPHHSVVITTSGKSTRPIPAQPTAPAVSSGHPHPSKRRPQSHKTHHPKGARPSARPGRTHRAKRHRKSG